MSQFVRDGEGSAEPVVLDDGAAVTVAHRPQFSQAKSVAILAGGVGIPANVLSEKRIS